MRSSNRLPLAEAISESLRPCRDLGRAMLQATVEQLRRRVIENAEIRQIAAAPPY